MPVFTVDEILDGQPVNMIKIDVQGFDREVVAGLSATFAANPDVVVLIEYWLGGMAERFIDLIEFGGLLPRQQEGLGPL